LKVLHFGSSTRPLFGALHAPRRLRARSAAVVLCNPFGEEAARAHRIYRVLALQLERAGYGVLRFDYAGTGDSLGDIDEVTIDDWIGDVSAAADFLATATGAKRVVGFGLRLGATLAALATSRGALRLRHLVMWDPVVEGKAYLGELAGMHRAYMREELGALEWRDNLEISTDGVPAESLGSRIRDSLGAQLAAIDLAAEELRTDHVTVIQTRSGGGLDRLHHKLPDSPAVKWLELPATAWESDAALNAMVVPMNIVQAVVGRIEELSP
jgi:pimeloyl-ACP methyl ester carboxylesterase